MWIELAETVRSALRSTNRDCSKPAQATLQEAWKIWCHASSDLAHSFVASVSGKQIGIVLFVVISTICASQWQTQSRDQSLPFHCWLPLAIIGPILVSRQRRFGFALCMLMSVVSVCSSPENTNLHPLTWVPANCIAAFIASKSVKMLAQATSEKQKRNELLTYIVAAATFGWTSSIAAAITVQIIHWVGVPFPLDPSRVHSIWSFSDAAGFLLGYPIRHFFTTVHSPSATSAATGESVDQVDSVAQDADLDMRIIRMRPAAQDTDHDLRAG